MYPDEKAKVTCPDCPKIFNRNDKKHTNDIAYIKVYDCCRQCYIDYLDAKYPAHPDSKTSKVGI